MNKPAIKKEPSYFELLHEIELLRSENARLSASTQSAYDYIRAKVNQLLDVIGTKTLKAEELDDASMIEFDPIGIVSNAFELVLKNLGETNRSLHFAHDEIQTIFDSVGAALLVLSPQRQVLAYNQKTKDLLIRDDRDITGQLCHKVVCGKRAKRGGCIFEMVMKTGCEQHIQDWSIDGRDFSVIGRPMYDENKKISHVVLSYTDVTERKTAETELVESLTEIQEANSQIQGILRSVSDCMLITDAEDKIVLLNRKAESLLGFGLMDRASPPGIELLPSEELKELLYNAKTYDPFVKQDLAFTDVKGTETIYQARVTVIRSPHGDYRGCVTFLHDVTEQRSVDRMKDEFVSTAAHELRTPLATIIGYTDLMLMENKFDAEEQAGFLLLIQKKAERLGDIVSDLLDISRIESGGGLNLRPKPTRLDWLCEEAVKSIQLQTSLHRFALDLSPGSDTLVNVDRYATMQILENLLSNAVKYSPEGGEIEVSVRLDNNSCHLTVSDQGIGMTSGQVKRIYDKFYRVDATNTAISGTGLGMTIVKHLVEAQSGQVNITSSLRLGTTVVVTLPDMQTVEKH